MSLRRTIQRNQGRRPKRILANAQPCCTHANMVKWSCDCSFGCGSCWVTHECKVCGRGYDLETVAKLPEGT